MSKTEEYISRSEQVILHTYNRFPVVLEKGDGVYLTDVEGKKYLDFGAGIAVFALGYHYQDYDEALKKQIDELIHTSNLYYHVPLMKAGEAVVKASGLSKVSSQTAEQRRSREPSRRQENMPGIRMAVRIMRSLP